MNIRGFLLTGIIRQGAVQKDGCLMMLHRSYSATFARELFRQTENKAGDEKIVIVKSWNEWAEGNVFGAG